MTPPRPERRRRLVGIVAAIAVVLAGAVIAITLLQDRSEGSRAIEQARESAGGGLRQIEDEIAARGGRLDVSWSAVPSPGGRGHVVVARLEVTPSGDVAGAEFQVVGDGVVPRNALARQLLDIAPPGGG